MNSPENKLVQIEINGITTQAQAGSMIIEAADLLGIEIPRFCYHPKLSIAANCRMCLVDVEKAPKPMPACATPVMEGMKVFTQSRRAEDAQRGVMEFLLINHPLDCPICDQGGECELQDQAMGYGRSVSRFSESKRVVVDKDVGSLIQTEMTRCIHCTRCVRFLDEIAGTSEMGGIGRGDSTEIGTMVARSIDSEMSGNIIDVCPVGALTNKPFRFSARAWELMARPSVAAHDGVGSNLYYHTRRGDLMRAVPRDNEALNQCWMSDRDRYSHFGLRSDARLSKPLLRDAKGKLQEVDWDTALNAAAGILKDSGESLGMLFSASAFNEEYLLARRLLDGLGSKRIDSRLRESAFADDATRLEQFECPTAEISTADVVLLIGSNIHTDAPILGHHLRQAWRSNQAAIYALQPRAYNYHFETAATSVVNPQAMLSSLLSMAAALGDDLESADLPAQIISAISSATADEFAQDTIKSLKAADNPLIILGNMANSHANADFIRILSQAISKSLNARINMISAGGNPTGARKYGAQPAADGLDVQQMLENPGKGWLLWDVDPELDFDNPAAARAALASGNMVAVGSFQSPLVTEFARVVLPLAAVAESEGSLTNFDGDRQPLSPAGKAPGMSKPGWKILRQLGSLTEVEGFEFIGLSDLQSTDEFKVRDNKELDKIAEVTGLQRLGEVGIYSVNAECRHTVALQESQLASLAAISMHPQDIEKHGLQAGASVCIRQAGENISLPLQADSSIAIGCALLPAAITATATLGSAWETIKVEAK